MKTILKLMTAVWGVLLLISCQDKIEESYKVNSPVYMSYEDLRNSFKVAGGEQIIQPGKIYFKGRYIFVNEYQKGIHVVDNTDPENPQIIKFIEIPGNVDMAVKGNILYADSYVDLVSIDISDMDNIVEVDRDTNVFPYIIPEIESGMIEQIDQQKGVVTGYVVTTKTEKVESNTSNVQRFPMWEDVALTNSNSSKTYTTTSSGSPGTNGTGIGGSLARFTIADKYLYTVDNYSLKLFDLTVPNNPEFLKEIYAGWNIETIFPYKDKLFMGSTQGMFVYSISDPVNPVQVSQFSHATACDPVVISGDYAYITLRGGNLCGAIESQLDVLDISNIESPILLKTFPLTEPYGLGIDDKTLFVCDGDAGLKIYDASVPAEVGENLIKQYPDINAYDVIPLDELLVLIGKDGLYQYDYSNTDSIRQLSYIPIYGKLVKD